MMARADSRIPQNEKPSTGHFLGFSWRATNRSSVSSTTQPASRDAWRTARRPRSSTTTSPMCTTRDGLPCRASRTTIRTDPCGILDATDRTFPIGTRPSLDSPDGISLGSSPARSRPLRAAASQSAGP
jgi:hypothetical protein